VSPAPTASYSISGRLARRVALLVGVALTVIVALIYATTAMLMQHKQASERAQKIEIIAAIAREAASEGGPAEAQHRLTAMAQRRPGTRLEVRHADGRVFYADPNEAPFRLADGERRDAFVIDLSAFGGDKLSATFAIDCLHDSQMMRSLAWFLFFVPLVGGGVVGAGTAWRVKRELRPLQQLAQQTQGISADRLDQRLALPMAAAELQPWIGQFNALMDRLQAAIEQLDAFNADVAHEMRTPIAALMGHIEVSLSRTRPAGELRETMALSLEELQKLSSLVDDMLFLSHADRGARARRGAPRSLRTLAEQVLEYHEITFEDASLAASVTGDAQAAVDDALIRRALSNLLANAARYADRGSTVLVRIEPQAGTDSARIVVENRGTPIDAQLLPRLFDRFFRAERARSACQQQHHGLGLAIVAAVARMHGGRTLAESADGVTRIGFELCCDGAAGAPPPAEAAAQGSELRTLGPATQPRPATAL
jgi:two-component system, OmpR family, heavy metal sensor histidine kinase CusS